MRTKKRLQKENEILRDALNSVVWMDGLPTDDDMPREVHNFLTGFNFALQVMYNIANDAIIEADELEAPTKEETT